MLLTNALRSNSTSTHWTEKSFVQTEKTMVCKNTTKYIYFDYALATRVHKQILKTRNIYKE